MATIDADFLDRTIAVWQPLSPKLLTRDDAREIIENAVGFYGTLIRWALEAEPTDTTNGNGARDAA